LVMVVRKVTDEVTGLEIEKRGRKGDWRIVTGIGCWERDGSHGTRD